MRFFHHIGPRRSVNLSNPPDITYHAWQSDKTSRVWRIAPFPFAYMGKGSKIESFAMPVQFASPMPRSIYIYCRDRLCTCPKLTPCLLYPADIALRINVNIGAFPINDTVGQRGRSHNVDQQCAICF